MLDHDKNSTVDNLLLVIRKMYPFKKVELSEVKMVDGFRPYYTLILDGVDTGAPIHLEGIYDHGRAWIGLRELSEAVDKKLQTQETV